MCASRKSLYTIGLSSAAGYRPPLGVEIIMNPLDKLAFDFFKLFARYEFALKDMGYINVGRNDEPNPAWDRFANEIGEQLFSTDQDTIKESIDYILSSPPKRQVVIEGIAQWQDVPNNERNSQALFGHIRRIRNNLFHGAKFNGTWFDPQRSEKLLSCGFNILSYCIELNDEINWRIPTENA